MERKMTTRRRVTICAALAVALTAHGVSVSAQQPTYKYTMPMPPTYKYTTPMPPGVASPDTVETRFGTLQFYGGFPDQASTDKIYDNLDFQRAVQAYLLALPAASLAAMRKGFAQWGPANTTVLIFAHLMDSRSIFLTANNNTVYSAAWIDLHEGPLVVEIPPKVLGVVDDFWFRYVVDVGFVGPDHGDGGKYLMLPPGYKGEVPDGYYIGATSHIR
jgi:hypothetical protein